MYENLPKGVSLRKTAAHIGGHLGLGPKNTVLLQRIGRGFPVLKGGTETWETISPVLSVLLLMAFGQ